VFRESPPADCFPSLYIPLREKVRADSYVLRCCFLRHVFPLLVRALFFLLPVRVSFLPRSCSLQKCAGEDPPDNSPLVFSSTGFARWTFASPFSSHHPRSLVSSQDHFYFLDGSSAGGPSRWRLFLFLLPFCVFSSRFFPPSG